MPRPVTKPAPKGCANATQLMQSCSQRTPYCVEALPQAASQPGEPRGGALQNAIVISGASALGARVKPACAGLAVCPSQNRAKCDKDSYDYDTHQQRVRRHDALPWLFWALLAARGGRH